MELYTFIQLTCMCVPLSLLINHGLFDRWTFLARPGRPAPRGNDAFLPFFRFPYFRKVFRRHGKFFKFDLFPKTFWFLSVKIFDDLLSPKFLMAFCRKRVHFPLPISGKWLFSLYLSKCPPDFVTFTCFYIVYVFFVSPHSLTMMHLCITQCTCWTSLSSAL